MITKKQYTKPAIDIIELDPTLTNGVTSPYWDTVGEDEMDGNYHPGGVQSRSIFNRTEINDSYANGSFVGGKPDFHF